jgi:hypothetical protein
VLRRTQVRLHRSIQLCIFQGLTWRAKNNDDERGSEIKHKVAMRFTFGQAYISRPSPKLKGAWRRKVV